MKIPRSQYLTLQNRQENHQIGSNNNGIEKLVSIEGKKHYKGIENLVTGERVILERRKGTDCFNSNSNPKGANINILFDNIDVSLKKLNLVLEFTDMSPLWLTSLYKTYENDLWRKKPRLDIRGRKEWTYHCGLCTNVYKHFGSTKSHLNLHLNLYPYVCRMCLNKYTSRKSATRHLKKMHHLECQQYNDFLIS